jgi:type I restriction enzyme S subunit
MTRETLFEKFDQFADAPDAVAKMRELVLEWATTGKLCHNDSVEWKEGVLGDVIELISGQHLLAHEQNEERRGIPYLTGPSDFGEKSPIPARWTDQPKVTAEPGDILITVKGSGVGKTNVLVDQPTAISRQLMAIRVTGADSEFVHVVLKRATEHFQSAKTGIAIPGIGRREVLGLKVVLPPLAEQKRIVAKVDELMALCDRLEAQQQEREEQASKLARASLARFADAPTPANLEYLFHSSFIIPPSSLRKSILTLAVQGKLVPQDPNDEPAEDLAARLEQERPRIAKEQGIRPPKNVPPLTADNFPHDIPESWQWGRIGHLALVIDYGTSQKADSDSSKVPVYRMGNIVGGRLIDENLKYVDAHIDDLPGLYLKTDDILFNRTNSYELVGKAGIFTGRDDTATFASYLIRIRLPSTLLFPNFFSIAMNAPYFRQTQIEPEVVQQCGQANFNGTKLASTVVPIPPLAEQHRIVAKVEQLMALVDALETQLAASRATAANLLSALVAELTT